MLSRLFGAITLALAVLVLSTFGASAATVEIPVGNWAATAITFALPFVGAGVIWVLNRIRAPWAQKLRTEAAEQLLAYAISFGFNATAGAVRGKAVSVNVGNEVVARALAYAIANGPAWLLKWLGGEAGIRDKILARLTVPEDAAIDAGKIVSAPPSQA